MRKNGKVYRDGATFTAALAYLRMGADSDYQPVAIACFGHVPTSHEMREAIERVRRQGVRADDPPALVWVERDERKNA